MNEYLPPLRIRFRCCRDWECGMPATVGRCGYCGERPTYVGPWEETDEQE